MKAERRYIYHTEYVTLMSRMDKLDSRMKLLEDRNIRSPRQKRARAKLARTYKYSVNPHVDIRVAAILEKQTQLGRKGLTEEEINECALVTKTRVDEAIQGGISTISGAKNTLKYIKDRIKSDLLEQQRWGTDAKT